MTMTAEEIVRLLAAIDDPNVEDRDYAPSAECGLCGAVDPAYRHIIEDPAKHADTCPWRLAKEWVGRTTDRTERNGLDENRR